MIRKVASLNFQTSERQCLICQVAFRSSIVSSIIVTLLVCANASQSHPAGVNTLPSDLEHAHNCGGQHKPGDKLTCRVTFAGATDFASVQIDFNLQTEEDAAERGASIINLVLRESRKVGKGTYEVSDIVPPQTASGQYLIVGISALTESKGYRLYSNGFGFNSILTVEIKKDPPIEKEPPAVAKVEPLNRVLMSGPTVTINAQAETPEQERKMFPYVVDISAGAAHPQRSSGPSKWFQRRPKTETCGGSHRPGYRMTCYVTFEASPAFTHLSLGLTGPLRAAEQEPKDQVGLCNDFQLQSMERVDDRTYKVTGALPGCATGRYVVSSVLVQNMQGRAHNYDARDLCRQIAVELRNSRQKLFPEVRDVGPD